LARRAQSQQGAVRDALEARLATLVEACAAEVAQASNERARGDDGANVPRAAGALASLLQRFERLGAPGAGGFDAPVCVLNSALDDVRRLSTRARSESQVRQALETAPSNAGPLNSGSLVHRALVRMQGASPGYLDAFMGYVDTLARLEGIGLQAPPSTANAGAPAGRPKRRRKANPTG
jgi:hypothetical protein